MRRRLLLPPTAVLVALLAGCAAPGATAHPEPATSSPAGSSPGDAVTVDNCGTKVTFPTAPERVVTIKSTSTEMLLALGLGDRIVGSAAADGPIPDSLHGQDVPVLSDTVPSEEAVLALHPDLVYAGWESNVSADGAGDRAELASLGVASYVSPPACQEPGYQPDRLGWDDVFGEIRQVGDIFRVPDRATALIDRQKGALDGITPDSRGLTALWWSSGTDTPFVGGGIGAPQLLLDTLGLTNIAGEADKTWTSYGWESIVAADPDVIVLVDATWNSAKKKMEHLASDPATAKLTAVREHRYLVVPFAASEAGARTADAAVDLAAQLAALG